MSIGNLTVVGGQQETTIVACIVYMSRLASLSLLLIRSLCHDFFRFIFCDNLIAFVLTCAAWACGKPPAARDRDGSPMFPTYMYETTKRRPSTKFLTRPSSRLPDFLSCSFRWGKRVVAAVGEVMIIGLLSYVLDIYIVFLQQLVFGDITAALDKILCRPCR
jgi:hypothetical protein